MYRIRLYAYDIVGNTYTSATALQTEFTIGSPVPDVTAPVSLVDAPHDEGGQSGVGVVDVSGLVSDAESGVDRVSVNVWKYPGLTDTNSEATFVVSGRKSRCHVHIHLSSVNEQSSWLGFERSRSVRSLWISGSLTAVYAAG